MKRITRSVIIHLIVVITIVWLIEINHDFVPLANENIDMYFYRRTFKRPAIRSPRQFKIVWFLIATVVYSRIMFVVDDRSNVDNTNIRWAIAVFVHSITTYPNRTRPIIVVLKDCATGHASPRRAEENNGKKFKPPMRSPIVVAINRVVLFTDAMITADVIGTTGVTIAAAATGWYLPSVAITSALAIGVYKSVRMIMRTRRILRRRLR